MATFVATHDIKITIDPGTALAPYRNKLTPHYLEIDALKRAWEKIVDFTKKSDVIIITHYHYDHFNPDQVWLFKNKTLLIKDPLRTNRSQRSRGHYFLNLISSMNHEFHIADGKTFRFGNTMVKLSEPVSHGPNQRLGKVIQVAIERDTKKFLFTSDIQGPCTEEHMEFIRRIQPTILYIDGPPFYLLGNKYPKSSYKKFLVYLEEITGFSSVEKIIIDHHALRVQNWRSFLKDRMKVDIVSGAEFLGLKETLLEANRKKIYRH